MQTELIQRLELRLERLEDTVARVAGAGIVERPRRALLGGFFSAKGSG